MVKLMVNACAVHLRSQHHQIFHSHTLSLSHPLTHTLSYTHSLTLTRSLSLGSAPAKPASPDRPRGAAHKVPCPSHSLTLSHTHYLSLTHTLSLSHTHSLSLSHTRRGCTQGAVPSSPPKRLLQSASYSSPSRITLLESSLHPQLARSHDLPPPRRYVELRNKYNR